MIEKEPFSEMCLFSRLASSEVLKYGPSGVTRVRQQIRKGMIRPETLRASVMLSPLVIRLVVGLGKRIDRALT